MRWLLFATIVFATTMTVGWYLDRDPPPSSAAPAAPAPATKVAAAPYTSPEHIAAPAARAARPPTPIHLPPAAPPPAASDRIPGMAVTPAELQQLLRMDPNKAADHAADIVTTRGLDDPRDAIGPYTADEAARLDAIDAALLDGSMTHEALHDELIKTLGKERSAAYLAAVTKTGQALARELLKPQPKDSDQ